MPNSNTTMLPESSDGGSYDDHLPSEQSPAPQSVQLEILGDQGKYRVKLDFGKNTVLIGRREDAEDVDVDMCAHGAYDLGVSRRHARLHYKSDGVYVEDLGSTNGTRINGFTLRPQQAYRLRNGDEIEFGRLRTVIRFNR